MSIQNQHVIEGYDVVVIGAGNGGLSAAAYLAKHNQKVLVCEKHNLAGGCATSFVRGRFEFEATLHEMCQMGDKENAGDSRKLLDSYGLDVNWVAIDEAFRSINRDKDNGFDVTMPVGIDAFVDEMEKAVPGSRESMETLMEMSRMISDGVDWLSQHNNEAEGLDKIKFFFKYKDLMKMVPISCDEMLRKIGLPDKAREIYESYWDYIGVDSTKMSFAVYAFMTYTYITRKPWIAKYRSHEICMAFDKVIKDNGGDIWYNTEVQSIDVKNNQVHGVRLFNGTYIKCNHVISNLMPTVVFDRMIDKNEVPERDLRLMNARKIAQNCLTIYCGLDIPYEELGFKAYDTFVRSTGDTLKQYNSFSTLDGHKDYCVTILDEAIADCNPKGTCTVQFSKFYTEECWENVTDEDYFKTKEKIARETIEDFEKLAGINISDHIEEIEIASPMTWARYLGTPQGDVYGYACGTWDGMFPRTLSGHHLDYTIKGLRFCGGHGTQMDGYSQSYLSGREQARYMYLDELVGSNG